VFYCDPIETNQKTQCERNHEQLRRLLPKGRSDFDRLSVWDVAACSSHVNSYPSAGRGGKCGFELAAGMLSQGLLDELGLERAAPRRRGAKAVPDEARRDPVDNRAIRFIARAKAVCIIAQAAAQACCIQSFDSAAWGQRQPAQRPAWAHGQESQ
jgi:hypothetical protein